MAAKDPAVRKAASRLGGKGTAAKRKTARQKKIAETSQAVKTLIQLTEMPKTEEEEIWSMTEDDAEEGVLTGLSPRHLQLFAIRRLRSIAREGGSAGERAVMRLLEMQRELVPTTKRSTLVSFMPQKVS